MFSNQSQAASCVNRTSCQGKPLWPFNFGNLVDRCSGLLSISQRLGSNICVSFFGALHQVVFAEEDHPLLVCNIAHLIVRGSWSRLLSSLWMRFLPWKAPILNAVDAISSVLLVIWLEGPCSGFTIPHC